MSTLPENVLTAECDTSLKISDVKRKRDDLHESEMNLSSALGERDERSITVEHVPAEMTNKNLSEYYAFFGDVKLVTIIRKFKRAYVCFATTEQAKHACSTYRKSKGSQKTQPKKQVKKMKF